MMQMDYTKFLMGFSHVDVCYAFRGWHARSYANHFPSDRKTSRRVCASVLSLQLASQQPATLMVLALQPTKRGTWCRWVPVLRHASLSVHSLDRSPHLSLSLSLSLLLRCECENRWLTPHIHAKRPRHAHAKRAPFKPYRPHAACAQF